MTALTTPTVRAVTVHALSSESVASGFVAGMTKVTFNHYNIIISGVMVDCVYMHVIINVIFTSICYYTTKPCMKTVV